MHSRQNIQRARNGTEITIYGVRATARILFQNIDNNNGSISANTRQSIDLRLWVNKNLMCLHGYRPDSETGRGVPLVEEADPRLDDALINLTAAYMTLGGQKMVDYWYSFYGKLIHIILNDLLDDIIAGMFKKAFNDEKVIQELKALIDAGPENWDLTPDPEFYKVDPDELNSKAVCHPWGTTAGVDITVPVDISGIGTVNVRITIN
jgi:hypothetical protein